jgi:hypothetical protein
MKVLSVIPKTYEKDGETKTLYNIALQKGDAQIGATSFAEVKVGDEIPEDKLHEGKRPGEWVIWSEKKGQGKQWVKNDAAIRAQCAFKGMIELINHDKMGVKELNSDTCIKFAQIIKKTEDTVKDTPAVASPNGAQTTTAPGPAAGKPSYAPDPPPEGIKNMGQLRMAIQKAYPILKTVAEQDKILGDTKQITDFGLAFQNVVDYMEAK